MSKHKNKEEEETESIKRDLRVTFDQIAEDFDQTRYKPWKECIEFAENIPKDSLILDIGCGNGRNSIFLAEKNRVVGLDMSFKMLALARNNIEKKDLDHKCDFIQSDILDLPIRSATIDVAYFIAALHHFPSEEERLRSLIELKRVLRGKGRGLISVWAFDQPRFAELLDEHLRKGNGFGDVHLEWKRKDGHKFKRYYHLFYGNELKDLALKAGLDVKEHFKSNNNYYAIVEKNSKD